MLDIPKFEEFAKIPRLSRDMVITEKLDGTNAQIVIYEDGSVLAGSRNRWITPENDNFGFARWVKEHEEELRTGLGIGQHFGEWWGSGIQRGYGLPKGEKRFSLFNVARWVDTHTDNAVILSPKQGFAPVCCHVVPVLYRGAFDTHVIENVLIRLSIHGSYAAPFLNPEGIIIWHEAARQLFKKTIEDDAAPKSLAQKVA